MNASIGLLGGLDLDEDLWFYRNLFLAIEERSHQNSSVQIILHGGDEKRLNHLLRTKDWESLREHYRGAAQHLEASGASMIVLCSDVMHHIAGDIEKVVNIPLIGIETALKHFLDKTNIEKMGIICCCDPEDHTHYKSTEDERLIYCTSEDSKSVATLFSGSSLPFYRSEEASRILGDMIDNFKDRGVSHILLTNPELTYAIGDDVEGVSFYCSDTIHKNHVAEVCLHQRTKE